MIANIPERRIVKIAVAAVNIVEGLGTSGNYHHSVYVKCLFIPTRENRERCAKTAKVAVRKIAPARAKGKGKPEKKS